MDPRPSYLGEARELGLGLVDRFLPPDEGIPTVLYTS